MNSSNKPILIALGFVVATGVIGSVFSPQNIVSILGFCGVVTVSLLGLVKSNETSVKVEEVKVDLAKNNEAQAEKLIKIEETGEKVHTLVNSNMGVQLKLSAELSRWKADQTNDPQFEADAKLAESRLREHEAKQALVDKKEDRAAVEQGKLPLA